MFVILQAKRALNVSYEYNSTYFDTAAVDQQRCEAVVTLTACFLGRLPPGPSENC
jgi:hypothetical protein